MPGTGHPQIVLNSDKMGGSVPFAAKLTATGTKDPDGDPITYSWKIKSKKLVTVKTYQGSEVDIKLSQTGKYKATLTASMARVAFRHNRWNSSPAMNHPWWILI